MVQQKKFLFQTNLHYSSLAGVETQEFIFKGCETVVTVRERPLP